VRLLLTRPEPQGERTAAALRARGHEVVLAPLLRIEPRASVDIGRGPWAAVLMTSANAVRFLVTHPRRTELLGLPLLVVGERTAEAAREAGFTHVQSADGDAKDLAHLALRTIPAPGPLLYLAGEDRTGDLAGGLTAGGYQVHSIVAYRARAEARLPDAVVQALRAGEIDGVLHFSKRTADAFVAAAGGSGLAVNSLKCNHFCLSSQVAEPLKARRVARVLVASRPEEAAVLDLVDKAL
jgi:uroporphyrinogen-III synthase